MAAVDVLTHTPSLSQPGAASRGVSTLNEMKLAPEPHGWFLRRAIVPAYSRQKRLSRSGLSNHRRRGASTFFFLPPGFQLSPNSSAFRAALHFRPRAGLVGGRNIECKTTYDVGLLNRLPLELFLPFLAISYEDFARCSGSKRQRGLQRPPRWSVAPATPNSRPAPDPSERIITYERARRVHPSRCDNCTNGSPRLPTGGFCVCLIVISERVSDLHVLGSQVLPRRGVSFHLLWHGGGSPHPSKLWVDLPPGAVAGLDGFYYNTNVTSTAQADAFIANNSPTATFHSTLLDYPAKAANAVAHTKTLSAFLGTLDSGSLSGFGGNTLDSSLFRFTGFIQIATAGDVNFALGSDDGMRLKIGDVIVTQYDGARSFGFSTGTASFSSAGKFKISSR